MVMAISIGSYHFCHGFVLIPFDLSIMSKEEQRSCRHTINDHVLKLMNLPRLLSGSSSAIHVLGAIFICSSFVSESIFTGLFRGWVSGWRQPPLSGNDWKIKPWHQVGREMKRRNDAVSFREGRNNFPPWQLWWEAELYLPASQMKHHSSSTVCAFVLPECLFINLILFAVAANTISRVGAGPVPLGRFAGWNAIPGHSTWIL